VERTLVLIKPDAMQRGLAGEIISRLERRGLRIAALRLFLMDEALARRHYAEHEGKPFFGSLISFITSSPIIAAVFEGTGAVDSVRQTIGSTNPASAAAGTVRGDLGLETGRNLIHASDSLASAQREIALFFREEDIHAYRRDVDRWIFESGG
jgi:nucleoside-diphosphate kinase